MKQKLKQLLLEKELQHWIKDNKSLYDDIAELSNLVVRFEIMYGIKLQIVYEDDKA